MKANNNTPAIRFAGYTAPWERRKLGDLASILGGYAWKSSDYHKDGDYLVVTIANVTGDVQIRTDIGNRINCPNPGAYRLNENDILISLTGNVGRVSRVPNVNAVLNQRVAKLCPDTRVTDKFLFQTIRNPKFEQAMLDAGQGAAQKNISNSDVLGYEVGVPIEAEQHKLGQVFEQIESLVTLHQRKYEKLVNLKKAMLDKMFPKNGELVPEVRFAGFSGNWERRKLGEIACKVTEKNFSKTISETFTNSAENGIISQREYFDHDISNPSNLADYFVVHENDFIYNPRISSTAPVGPVNRNKLNRKGLVSPIYTVFRTYEIDNLYLEYFFKTRHWHPYMFCNGDSGARSDRFSIKDSLFMSMPIVLPSQSEQKSIGRFLECVDSIIMLQHQKLERLQNLKKAFLEKMFV